MNMTYEVGMSLFIGWDILANIPPLFVIAVSATLHLLLGIIIHELVHLIFGFISGYSFSSFRVGSLVCFKEDKRLRFKISGSLIEGQCLMTPDPEKFKFVLYNLGGGIFNIIFLILFLILFITIPRDSFWSIQLIMAIVINFFIALSNLFPIRYLANDGANVREALKCEEAARGLHTMFLVNSEAMEGRRYRDFSEDMFKISENADRDNYLIAYIIMLEASRLEDLGSYDEAANLYESINLKKMPSIYKSLIMADLLYYYTIYKPDFEKAREIYKDKKLRNILNLNMPNFMRILAAYEFYVLDNKHKAVKLMEKAKIEADKLPNKGFRIMEKEYIQKLNIG